MSAKRIWLAMVVTALLGVGAGRVMAQGQVIGTPPTGPADTQGPGGVIGAPAPTGPPSPAQIHYGAGLSSWLLYPRSPGSSGPVGADGPIGWEAFLRNGLNWTLGGNYFGRTFGAGWQIEGGVRSLFFNPAMDGAWTVELGIGNINADATDRLTSRRLLAVPEITDVGTQILDQVDVTMRGMNRTYVMLDVGREIWLYGSGESDGETPSWRAGVDGGGRYGTMKLDVNELRHLTDTTASLVAAVHTDVEMGFGACILYLGLRCEWAYTFADILQHQNNSDIQDINLLINGGIRY